MSDDVKDADGEKIEELLRRVEDLLRITERELKAAEPEARRWLDGLAGAAVDSMYADAQFADDMLYQGDRGSRVAALFILFTHWKLTDKYRTTVEDLALGEADPELRQWALRFLTRVYRPDSVPADLCQRLARIVRDESEVTKTRELAYSALRELAATSRADRSRVLWLVSFDEIEWDYVDRFMSQELL